MSERHSHHDTHRCAARVSPVHRLSRAARRFLTDAREAWRDPSVTPATPTLSGYPLSRP